MRKFFGFQIFKTSQIKFETIIRGIIFVVSILLIYQGQKNFQQNQIPAGSLTSTLALLLLVFVFLPEFQRFKGLGIEAELREKVDEADKVISKLKNLFALNARVLFSLSARMGRFGSHFSNKEQFELSQQLDRELASVNILDRELFEIKKDFHRFMLIDLAKPLFKNLRNLYSKKRSATVDKDLKKALEAEELIMMGLLKDTDIRHISQKWQDLIQYSKVFSEDEKSEIISANSEFLEDLRFYSENLQIRRLDVWLKEEEYYD